MQTLFIYNNTFFYWREKRGLVITLIWDRKHWWQHMNKTLKQPSYHMNTNPLSDKAKPDLSD